MKTNYSRNVSHPSGQCNYRDRGPWPVEDLGVHQDRGMDASLKDVKIADVYTDKDVNFEEGGVVKE